MKSAMLLSKSASLFPKFVEHCNTYQIPVSEVGSGLVRIAPEGAGEFTLFERDKLPGFFERYELPLEASEQGYIFGYLAECNSEVLFCQIMKTLPFDFDILICDSNGDLYTQSTLNPLTLHL